MKTIFVVGTKNFLKVEKLNVEFVDPTDFDKLDEIIYSNVPVILNSEKENIDFISTYLAEYRLINKHPEIVKRKVVIYNHKSFFDPLLKCLREYRSNLPDETNKEEAKDWFIYPQTKQSDIFFVSNQMDEIESIVLDQLNENHFSILDNILKNKLNLKLDVRTSDEKHVFVPAAAFGWTKYDKLAYDVGKTISEKGWTFVNGGPDGGRYCNGPMRQSALGFVENCDRKMIAVYSKLVYENYVEKSSLEPFMENTKFIFCGTETERKKIMIELADQIFALPGAIGTWAEITTALNMKKKVFLFGDYWESFKNCLDFYQFENLFTE